MKKFLKFGTVGIFNTLITIGFFSLFVHLGMNYIAANVVSYFIGMINSFFWNKNWVFQVQTGQLSLFLKFMLVNLVTLGFNTACLYILVDHLQIQSILAQIFSTGFGLILNFGLNKKWTFTGESVRSS
ncbi:GtrA family protein [Bacillus sp. BRMEA1]|uniref:GtrA family protein n=1 Tax=Neobacillus endophyticus TaxID=2738405 RepID=UPI00156352D2|nr:GtrA family protein [Neobacillus endophyticus]NRD76688.1 GtrA family protein [Neobacillus endophyticus]